MTTNVDITPKQPDSAGILALRGDQVDWTPAQQAALSQIGITDAPLADQKVFLHVAQRSGLDPFARQIYMICRWDQQAQRNKWTIQTGIDGYRVIAERRQEYAGQLEPQWCGEDGQWKNVWISNKPPVAARVGVIRRDWPHPAWGVTHFSEFAATTKSGSLTHMWATKPRHQLSKCAEAAALRRAFPQDFAGIYTDEEMEHLDNPTPHITIETVTEKPTEPDWDTLIPQHETSKNRDELGKLWTLARAMRPNDGELHERIAAAGQRVNAAQGEADNDETHDIPDVPATTAQTRKLFAILKQGEINDDEQRHTISSRVLQRTITTWKDLTKKDANILIETLEPLAEQGPLSEVFLDLPSVGSSVAGDAA